MSRNTRANLYGESTRRRNRWPGSQRGGVAYKQTDRLVLKLETLLAEIQHEQQRLRAEAPPHR